MVLKRRRERKRVIGRGSLRFLQVTGQFRQAEKLGPVPQEILAAAGLRQAEDLVPGEPALIGGMAELHAKCMQSMLFIKASGKPGQAGHQDEDSIPTWDRSLIGAWLPARAGASTG